jgi:hypothetical protein
MSVAVTTEEMDGPGRARRGAHRAGGLGGQAGTIREMLATLETLTRAGQRHSMEKIVAFLAAHVPVAGHGLGRGNMEALMRLLQSLRRESERSCPDSVVFSLQAENTLALMGRPFRPSIENGDPRSSRSLLRR